MMLGIDVHRLFAMVAIQNGRQNKKILKFGRNLVSK
jgi:hypothetical protein